MGVAAGSKLANRYELRRELARGGMGVVYLAYDPLLDREVALKLVARTTLTPEFEQRFAREARVVAKLDHPSIVSVYDFGAHEGQLFFVMPLVGGANLRSWLEAGRLRLQDVLEIGIQTASALDYSHALGVVHRDIKPENLMLERQGDVLRVRVTDFGLALAEHEQRITFTGELLGTLSYFSPEQVKGHKADARSDIYALGVVLHECLVGEPPFTGDSYNVLFRTANESPASMRVRAPSIDPELDAIVLRCLARDPSGRPATARIVADELARYAARVNEATNRATLAGTMAPGISAPTAPAPGPPLVGRAEELAALHEVLHTALAGECQLTLLAGEAGIGKTRLLDELESIAQARHLKVLRASFVEPHQALPLQGLCDLLALHFRTASSPTAGPQPDFSDLAADLVALFPALREIDVLRSPIDGAAQDARAMETDPTRSFEVLARAFVRIGAGKPLVLLLDDLHLGAASVDALHYISMRLGASPTLIVGAYTESDVDRGHPVAKLVDAMKGSRRFSIIRLGRLSSTETRELVAGLVGSTRLDGGLVTRIYEAGEGNPYVTREMARALLESEPDATGRELPATLREAVQKRLQRLNEGPKRLLTFASVLGRSFNVKDLEALASDDVDDLDALEELVRRGFVEEERGSRDERMVFTSALTWEVLSAAVPRRRRRALHARAAEAIVRRSKGRLERVYPELLHHYAGADMAAEVIDYGLRLARHAMATASVDEAVQAARTVLTFLEDEGGEDPAVEKEARLLLARAHRIKGQLDLALKELDAAARAAEKVGGDEELLSVLVVFAEVAWEARRVRDAGRAVERGLELARRSVRPDNLRRLLVLGATIANLRGDFERAREYDKDVEALDSAAEGRVEERPRGGEVIAAYAGALRGLSPAQIELSVDVHILSNVFETLVASDPHGQPSPNLSTHWESLEGGRVFVFTLRDNVVFHDGHELDAQAVVDSFELARAAAAPPMAFLRVLSMTATSPRSVRVELDAPLPIFPVMLTAVATAIARVSVLPSGEETVVGTGPFQLVVASGGRRLVRFEGYRDGGPRVDAVVLATDVPVEDIAEGMRSGKFDITGDLPHAELEQLLRARKGFTVLETGRPSTAFVVFNGRSGPCRDERLRAVLSHSVHPQEIVWRSLARFALPAVAMIPPGILAHDAGRRRTTMTREQALAELDDLGLKRPLALQAAVTSSFARKYARFLEALLGAWRDVGIEVRVVTCDLPPEESAVAEASDLMIVMWSADYDDPDDFTHNRFHSRAGEFRRFFGDPELDRVTEEARITTLLPLREKLYREAEELLLRTNAVLPLFHDVDHRVVSPSLEGVKLLSAAPYVNFADLAKVPRGSVLPARSDRGGVLRIPLRGTLSVVDPRYVVHAWEHFLLANVFETLVRETEGGGIRPHLAREVRAEDGGRRYRFFLRENVLFHDGRRLTARDVRASFERLCTHPSGAGQTLFPIRGARALARGEASTLAGFEIVSPLELVVHLEQPLATFAAILSQTQTAILPEDSRSSGTWRDAAVGTGPFRIARFEPGTRLELEAHAGYWRAGSPRADMIVFELGVPPQAAAAAFEQGRASLVTELLVADVERLRANPRFASSCSLVPSLGTYAIHPHVGRPPLNNPALRQRLFASVDVVGAVQRHVGNRDGLVASTYLPPVFLDYEPARPSRPELDDETKAGERIPIRVLVAKVLRDLHGPLVTELLESFAANGFAPTLVADPVASDLLDAYPVGEEADVLITRWYANYPSADGFLFTAIHSKEGDYGLYSGTPEIDELLERARREPDTVARQALYRTAEAILAEQAIVLPLFHPQNIWFVHPDVQGGQSVVVTSANGYPLENLWVRG